MATAVAPHPDIAGVSLMSPPALRIEVPIGVDVEGEMRSCVDTPDSHGRSLRGSAAEPSARSLGAWPSPAGTEPVEGRQWAIEASASGSMVAMERVSWKARTPSMPCSRPKPDCFMPPNGARRSRRVAPWSLTQT
jgi:hypothetical protein